MAAEIAAPAEAAAVVEEIVAAETVVEAVAETAAVAKQDPQSLRSGEDRDKWRDVEKVDRAAAVDVCFVQEAAAGQYSNEGGDV